MTYCLNWSNFKIFIIILGCGVPSKEDREKFITEQVQGDITSPVQVNRMLKYQSGMTVEFAPDSSLEYDTKYIMQIH